MSPQFLTSFFLLFHFVHTSYISIITVVVVVVVVYYPPCSASTRFRVTASPYGASLTHSLNTPHSVGLLWTGDQPDAQNSDYTQRSRQTSMPPAGFEPAIPSDERPADTRLSLRPRGHQNRRHHHHHHYSSHNYIIKAVLYVIYYLFSICFLFAVCVF